MCGEATHENAFLRWSEMSCQCVISEGGWGECGQGSHLLSRSEKGIGCPDRGFR